MITKRNFIATALVALMALSLLSAAGVVTTTKVVAADTQPIVNANGPYTGTVGQPIKLNATASDPDGDQLTYDWCFGDGSLNVTGELIVYHIYAQAGTYTAMITVSDGHNVVTEITTVTVNEAPTKDAVLAKVTTLTDQLADTATTSFKTPQSENAFVNKLSPLAKIIDHGNYDAAQAKLTNDLMKYNTKWGTQAVGATLEGISNDLAILQAQG